jgi:hypothetical protein
MYLACFKKEGKTRFVIRQSYLDGDRMKSRDLFDLGTDPTRYIVYVGGSGYYYDAAVHEALSEAGVENGQDELDRILFDFLNPRIQRVIHGFDRGRRHAKSPIALTSGQDSPRSVHLFDKRRYHYLRFGHSEQRHIHRIAEKIFRPLYAKSRDELEQYFLAEERFLKAHQRPLYVSVIFELKRFVPDNAQDMPLLDQMDAFFISRLCRLNADARFWSDAPIETGLRDYLTKYAIMYFDFEAPHSSPWQAYVEDFIHRHRAYHPPRMVQIKIEEAGRLFGMPWKALKRLDQVSLSRLYRKLALKLHPDQGGDPELFRKLTHYYQVLSKKRH